MAVGQRTDAAFSAALGARVRALRQDRGLPLSDFADRLDMQVRQVESIERGRTSPTPWELTRMAQVLGCAVGELVELTPPGTVQEPGSPRSADPEGWRTSLDVRLSPPPLQAALEVFAETGYHGATVRDIAERWGLSVPGMYHHYAGKREILAATLEALMAEVVWRCDAAVADGHTTVERFSNLVECLSLLHTTNPAWGLVGRSEVRRVVGPALERIRGQQRHVQELFIRQIERGSAEGIFDVHSASRSALDVAMMCAGASEWVRPGGSLTPADIARQHVRHALRIVGYRVPAAARPAAFLNERSGESELL